MNDTNDLIAERKKIDDEIAALAMEPAAAEFVQRADEIIAAHDAKVAALRAKRYQLDEQFRVKERESAATEARQREEQRLALDRELVEQEQARLQALAQAEGHLRSVVDNINAAFEAHTREREIANKISGGARMLTGLSPTDFANRVAGRIGGILAGVKVPGALKGSSVRIGALELPNVSLFPASQSWRDREEAAVAPAIQELLEHGRRDR